MHISTLGRLLLSATALVVFTTMLRSISLSLFEENFASLTKDLAVHYSRQPDGTLIICSDIILGMDRRRYGRDQIKPGLNGALPWGVEACGMRNEMRLGLIASKQNLHAQQRARVQARFPEGEDKMHGSTCSCSPCLH